VEAARATTRKLPRRLYKYRAFGVQSLRLLSEAEVYYANPRSFNDPLDCDPTIQIDTDRLQLEKLCFRMLLATRVRDEALTVMNNFRYLASEYGNYKDGGKGEKYDFGVLASEIKDLLDGEMSGRGLFLLRNDGTVR